MITFENNKFADEYAKIMEKEVAYMNLRDFEFFHALGEVLSFTQVAHQFGVSQPTISHAMKRLEEYYDCDLIKKDPSHRFVVLTKEGEILKTYVRHILYEFTVLQRAIEHARQDQVYVGFPPMIRARLLPGLLTEEGAVELISSFELVSGGSKALLLKLLSGQLEFSLIGSVTPLVHPNLTVKQLYQRDFYIFVAKENPLAQKKEISFEEALDYPFVLLENDFVHTKAFQNLSDKYRKKARILFRFSDAHTIGQMVKSNVGITLMTDFLPFQDMKGLVKIPLVSEDKVSFYVQYAYLRNAVLSDRLLVLIDMLDKLSRKDQSELS